ncbi:polysaccharide deacetylase family protein [Halobacillus sp. Marseille-Q1614]|uniref:polysaccharide deacetylase family protein n=1 Tax=Halobacillus sp. Marseille-Q1614 TaxID=2709134 RepID=UPI0015712EB3|nr:polysaccharide deacetylase family protein [Halobacillus sp. Marseille-Q1614]
MLKKVIGLIIVVLICTAAADKPLKAETYTVQKGDTLSKIADRFGVSEDKIANLNKLLSTQLEPGRQLEIPVDIPHFAAKKLGVSLPELLIGPSISSKHLIKAESANGAVYMGDSSKKRIALTFDDGPEDQYTPEILEILKEKDVKATFFVTGKQAKEYPAQLEKIHEDGHVIGNHTWNHPNITELTDKQLNKNVESTAAEIKKVTGSRPDLFRPPFGEMEDRQVKLLDKDGYHSILWTADTKDWMGVSSEEIITRVKQDASPGVIVLQHNYHSLGQFETVEALPQIIDDLRADGYEFVTVTKLLESK